MFACGGKNASSEVKLLPEFLQMFMWWYELMFKLIQVVDAVGMAIVLTVIVIIYLK